MNIRFTLNGQDVLIDVEPERRVLNILREDFGYFHARGTCYTGECGACTIFFNGEIAPSCLIPAFTLRESKVITFEWFSETEDCQDIIKGLADAGYESCKYCTPARILVIHALLENNPRPDEDEILRALSGMRCYCSDYTSLIEGVKNAGLIRNRRR